MASSSGQKWKSLKRFLSVNPPEFHGLVDPIAVSDWILGIENIFKICQTSEDHKVPYASLLLRANALHWWSTITSDDGKETMKWEEFKDLIFNNFSPKNLMLRLKERFTNLRQGNMSVRCYTNEFLKLSRFASDEVLTNERKIERFVQGLDIDVHMPRFFNNPITFEEVVERALLAEDDILTFGNKEDARPKKARKRRS
ncbi:hypothetical protein OSB04_014271 [Centaurea solstitialis]|uniref:Retrotransposon gag domain-containing protein n=1 Tax=Centaurea solstitialis TaxID=347529 RepID=A0AA38T814_9ASTR|nr:hypothetical protein OSB04_014271 [Centaurea solstitialis]